MSDGQVVNVVCDDALGSSDAVELAQRISSGEVSAKEVVEAAIARTEKANADLNAVVTKTYKQARQDVETQATGAFAGVPTFIKDNTDVAGAPTLQGSRALPRTPAKKHAPFTQQMQSLGAITLGKTALPEFGIPPTTESTAQGATCNPWNTGYTTGGSSGGSAAMVAAGAVPIAHANDGGGSIRIPASCCGLVGLKPTRNRLVNPEGVDKLPINVVHEGVVTRSVRDTAYFLAEAETFFKNSKLPGLGLVKNPGKKRLRIGILRDAIDNIPVNEEIMDAINFTAKQCEDLGHSLEEVANPFTRQFGEDFIDYYGFLFFALHRFGKLLLHPEFDKSKLEKLTYAFSNRFFKRIYKLPFIVSRLRKGMQIASPFYEQYDLILTPVLVQPPVPLGTLLDPAQSDDEMIEALKNFAPFTALQNITGEPAISLPMSMGKNNLPIGVQFIAPYGEDKRLLEIAYELEEAAPWPQFAKA